MFVLGRISLGALMVTSGRLWYQVYQRTTQAWGFAPIEDQDLGAVALWVPAMLIATLLTVALYSGRLRLPNASAHRAPTDLVRLERPRVEVVRPPDSGAWQH